MSLIAFLVSYTGITVTHRLEDERRFRSTCTSSLLLSHGYQVGYVIPVVWGVSDSRLMATGEREKERTRWDVYKSECYCDRTLFFLGGGVESYLYL